jgi:chromosome partitioning protein
MKTLSVLSQKGGSGKTTLAIHVAAAASLKGQQVALVDLDPQASAASWGDSQGLKNLATVLCQYSLLDKVLATAQTMGTDFVFIDTAPHSERAALEAAKAADLILIPCRPAILDLRAIKNTIDIVNLVEKPAVIILNAVPPRGKLVEEARAALATYSVPVCPFSLVNRSVFSNALTAGLTAQEYEPNGKAAEEISQLYQWLWQHPAIKP